MQRKPPHHGRRIPGLRVLPLLLLLSLLSAIGPAGAGETCLAQAVPGTSAQDTATPPAGSGFFYLVRGTNSCGDGSWGAASGGGERDSSVCP